MIDRLRRAMKRHPGVAHSLRRAALVGAVGAGLAFAGARNARLGRRALRELGDVRLERKQLRALFPARAQAYRPHTARTFHALEQRAKGLKRAALGYRRSSRRLAYASAPVGLIGAPWAAVPAGEALDQHRARRDAHRSTPTIVVRRRRRAA